ncbi:SLOG family protein [Streptomyces sp. NPDC057235]|uniref:SLOG family protein n=1 Tax=Streptomyces sp. NPDC057235 TaxID=3346058 RepID=UPI0036377E78
MKVLVTGSRKWADAQRVFDALWEVYHQHGAFQLIHGACATGADDLASYWYRVAGKELGCTEQRWPANWSGQGKAAGPLRNVRMVSAGADLVLAFPLPEGSGTRHTIKLAREAGIEVKEFTS